MTGSAAKKKLSFEEISRAIKKLDLPGFDLVVGIADGGIVPACLMAYKIGCPLELMKVNYRDSANKVNKPYPEIIIPPAIEISCAAQILIVDDVSVSGSTLAAAKDRLSDFHVKTMVLIGKADFVLFPEISGCVLWPWALYNHYSKMSGEK